MTDKPANWMDQAGDLYKQWADQQHNFFRGMVGGVGSLNVGGTPTADAATDVSESLRRAQALWQSSMNQWVALAKEAMPQSGITGESLKMLFDPGQWAQAGDEKKLLNFLRMEKWLADRPHHPGEAAKQWLKDLYQQNKLVKNQFELGGRKVELANIPMPVLNVYAKEDHIIPPQCSRALGACVGTDDYSEIGLTGGHVGVFASGKSQGVLAEALSTGSRSDGEPCAKRHGCV